MGLRVPSRALAVVALFARVSVAASAAGTADAATSASATVVSSAVDVPTTIDCDVLVVGGGTGGVAAAIAATRNGCSTVILEETDWLGGQLTSQGVSCPDEHSYIETCATASYGAFRRLVREYYQLGFRLSEKGRAQKPLNPGAGWVSHICHEPRAGLAAIDRLLRPAIDTGMLRVLTNASVTGVEARAGMVSKVEVRAPTGATSSSTATAASIVIHPRYVIEATPLGDFLEQAGVPFSVGMESQSETGEPHAYPGPPDPRGVQGFTYCFAVERRPVGENHTIAKPALYDRFNLKRRYGLNKSPMFEDKPGKASPFWMYRRLLAAELFDDPRIPSDIAMINWGSNDYHERDLIGASPAERAEILDEAKQQSLGFLYWLQTECPRDEGGKGYPEFKLRPDVMGTTDGLSKYPYIRESRRIRALKTVVEKEVTSNTSPHARAAHFDDTVGTAFYYMVDIHVCVGDPHPLGPKGWGVPPAKPFEIPLGALIPKTGGNVLAGGKNLGVTHVANGAYRMHPGEWSIGEAAGTLAAMCVEKATSPEQVRSTPRTPARSPKAVARAGRSDLLVHRLACERPVFRGARKYSPSSTAGHRMLTTSSSSRTPN